MDLLLLAAWTSALSVIDAEPIPVSLALLYIVALIYRDTEAVLDSLTTLLVMTGCIRWILISMLIVN